jgi:hypothetical protein
MRYYDISGRIAVFNLAHAVTVTAGSTSASTTHIDPVTGNGGFVDRTGYYSYIAHVVLTGNMYATDTTSVSIKMQSSTDGTSFTSPTDFTSVTSTDADYKQLYFNKTGTTAGHNLMAAGFQDQAYTFTSPTSASATTTTLDCRIFGSFRDKNVVGKYVAPYVTFVDTKVAGSANTLLRASVNLLLGGGDQMPVFEAGTAGTGTYYSKGQ